MIESKKGKNWIFPSKGIWLNSYNFSKKQKNYCRKEAIFPANESFADFAAGGQTLMTPMCARASAACEAASISESVTTVVIFSPRLRRTTL